MRVSRAVSRPGAPANAVAAAPISRTPLVAEVVRLVLAARRVFQPFRATFRLDAAQIDSRPTASVS
jgi:hypothetical protein